MKGGRLSAIARAMHWVFIFIIDEPVEAGSEQKKKEKANRVAGCPPLFGWADDAPQTCRCNNT